MKVVSDEKGLDESGRRMRDRDAAENKSISPLLLQDKFSLLYHWSGNVSCSVGFYTKFGNLCLHFRWQESVPHFPCIFFDLGDLCHWYQKSTATGFIRDDIKTFSYKSYSIRLGSPCGGHTSISFVMGCLGTERARTSTGVSDATFFETVYCVY